MWLSFIDFERILGKRAEPTLFSTAASVPKGKFLHLSRADELRTPVGVRGIAAVHDFPYAQWALVAGCLALALPTMMLVVSESWTTEQGGHGPIVFMTGLWLLSRLWPKARPLFRPPATLPVVLLLAPTLALLVLARVVHVLEIEGFILYAALVICLYSAIGFPALRRLWFPLFYLAFAFPLPETLVAFITLPLKTLISEAAVVLLTALGYPVGSSGVMIYIGQYELLVAAACSGLNSIISLSIIGLFYLYVRHGGNWRQALPTAFMIVPVAILANFFRVLILVLLTYHAGDAAAQGFLHDFAGLSMFVVALALLVASDGLFGAARRWRLAKAPS